MKKIPKKIHYCWFGGNPLTPLAKECIESWKKYCPDYEIVEWNETNVDIDSSSFMRDAYKNKKWAFVSDYARNKAVYDNGGVYLDVDVEIIKNIDDLLSLGGYMGFEGNEYVNSGLGFGATAGDKILKEVLDTYDKINYEDYKDNPAEISAPIILTRILSKYGFQKNGEMQKIGTMTILPEDYLSPKNPITRLINTTDNSRSIHHFDASWVGEKEREHIDDLEMKSKNLAKQFPDLISIIIPVYNGADYLAHAIDSALNQTYKNLEVIVVDDGSKDATEEIARAYGPRIRYIRKENGGVSSALNTGIKNMRGKYFAWLSHDDVYHERKLEILHSSLKELDGTIAISDWDIIDAGGTFLRKATLDIRLETSPKSFLAFDRNTWLNACAMLIPKRIFDEVGFFDESLRTTQDYDMHLRMIEAGVRYKITRKSLFYSRAHANQGSLTIDDDTFKNSDKMHEQIISSLDRSSYDTYFNGNVVEFHRVYRSFVKNGYSLTPVAMVSRMLELYPAESGFLKNVINRTLLSLGDDAPSSAVTQLIKDVTSPKGRRPRLMFCSGKWMTGGMERVMSNLFGHLSKKYDIYLVTPGEFVKSSKTIPLPGVVKHITLDEALYLEEFDVVGFSLARLLKVDVVIGFLNLNERQLKLYEHCVDNGIKTIASNHEYYFYPYRSLYAPMRRLALRRKEVYKKLDAVLWLTNFNTAIGKLDSSNAYVMPNPNTYEVAAGVNKEKSTGNILCVGRFNDHVKRVDRMLKIYSLVAKSNPDITLTLVGDIDLDKPTADAHGRTINQLMDLLGLSREKINIVGETKDTLAHYANADVLLMTSETEGFPMVATEAMSQGLPVVCGDIPGIEDIVVDGITGYTVNQDDYEVYATRLLDIISNDENRSTLSKNAIDHVEQFDGKIIADRWISVIDLIMSGQSIDDARLNSTIVQDDKALSKSLMHELDTSLHGSVVMWEGYDFTVKETKREKAERLMRGIKRDYEVLGISKTGKKLIKKVAKKTKSVLRID